jgi:dihydrofolate reductase
MFMKANIVDTIYLTIEPIFFGKGISIFNDSLHYNLILQNSQVSELTGTILTEYKVDYSGTPKMKD